MIEQQISTYRE